MPKPNAKEVLRKFTIEQFRVSQINKNVTNPNDELSFDFRPYSLDPYPYDFFPFSDLQRMLTGKIFSDSEELIAKAELYFEAKDKLHHKNGIEKYRIR